MLTSSFTGQTSALMPFWFIALLQQSMLVQHLLLPGALARAMMMVQVFSSAI